MLAGIFKHEHWHRLCFCVQKGASAVCGNLKQCASVYLDRVPTGNFFLASLAQQTDIIDYYLQKGMLRAAINGFAICGFDGRYGSGIIEAQISQFKGQAVNPPNPIGKTSESPCRKEYCLTDSRYEKDSKNKRIQATPPGK
jgi:hypothetical protein